MKGKWFVVVLAAVLTTANAQQYGSTKPIVEIDVGKVEGLVLNSSEKKREFNAFLSIPYAEPPVGPLRFMPPEPKEPWTGVFQANRKNILCPQFGYDRQNDTEDCLVLNVYSPRISKESTGTLLPVMVIFHEGGFLFGTGSYDFYRPEKLMDYDVVFVSTNYRLGVLGFLNTEDEQSPGNYGMLDQVAVLNWVKNNIDKFGGDPNRVTIFGNSAGACSVVYHMLSPLSNGLFHSAIAQSGSALLPATFQPQPLEWAKKVGRLANCTDDGVTKNIVDCLRNKTIDELFRARKSEVKYYTIYNVGPSVDCREESSFLKEHPFELMKKGQINKVPFITGVVKDEGGFLIYDIIDFKKYSGQKFLDEEFCGFLAYILYVEESSKFQKACASVKKEYFDGHNITDPEVLKSCLIKSLGDMALCAGTSKTAELFSAAGIPTQAYKFTYSIEGDNVPGNLTGHGDEITLMLDRKWSEKQVINNTENDRTMGNLFNYIWTQFATNGHNSIDIRPPGIDSFEWPLFNAEVESSKKYLDINMHPHMEQGLLCDKTEFWTQILISLDKL